jgi:Protein of unknown function (DUF3800)
MEVFFADDSVQTGFRRNQGKLVGFGGVFVDETELRPLSLDMDQIAAQYRIPPGVELKWSPPRRSWLHDNLGEPERPACYGAVLDAAARHGARALVAVVDTGRTSWSSAFALKECAKYVWERVEIHLSRPAGRTGLIVADRPGGGAREEEALLADFLAMSSVGTGWVLPTNVALNILTTPSHLVRHLQLADIVTGATVAAVAGSRYAPPVFASVKPRISTSTFSVRPRTPAPVPWVGTRCRSSGSGHRHVKSWTTSSTMALGPVAE